MKKLKRTIATVVLSCLVTSGLVAQQIDQKKMDRDIEIAEDILMSMMKQDKEVRYNLISEPHGMYVEDYGVIFNISGSTSPIRMIQHWRSNEGFGHNFDFNFDFDDSFVVDTDEINRKAQIIAREAQRMARENQRILVEEHRVIREQSEELQRQAEEIAEEAEHMNREAMKMAREAEKEARKAEKEARKHQDGEVEEEIEIDEDIDIDEDIEADIEEEMHWHVISDHPPGMSAVIAGNGPMKPGAFDSVEFQTLMTDFLVDYASLIGQLKPDQKIMVSSGSGGKRQFGRSYYDGKLTAEVTKSDLDDYKKGKLSREKLIEKIVINKTDDTKAPYKDLELFSTIFERLYEHDLAETYYMSRGLSYERLMNFGVIYSMKVYSSKENNGKYSIPTQNLYDLSFEERNQKVKEMYPEFEQELKANILDYGKTIKSLAPNETLLFQVKLTECKDCGIPRNIDVSVKQSVLSDYGAGKLSQSDALKKVNVKKHL
ncbi:MAG: hypothetical protein RIG77_06225 [Cyclobacteriaceae bacterium]